MRTRFPVNSTFKKGDRESEREKIRMTKRQKRTKDNAQISSKDFLNFHESKFKNREFISDQLKAPKAIFVENIGHVWKYQQCLVKKMQKRKK
jgi:hypothetical protein